MNQNKHFEMRYAKLTREAILKALLVGLVVAFGAMFVAAIALWFSATENSTLVLGVLLGVFALVTVVTAAIFYFAKFRPTVKSNARRIDGLGLEERAITMIEYKNDDSVMARLQRDDALAALERIKNSNIRFSIPRKLIIALSVTAVVGLAFGTLSYGSSMGWFPDFDDFMDSLEETEYVEVIYMADEGGYIDGEEMQLVLMGENASTVIAIPEEGYSFEGWDDGYRKPDRTDEKIDHPLVLTAIFLPLEEDGDDDGGDEHGENGEAPGEEEGDGDQKGDQPGEPSDNGDPGDEGGGKYDRANQIIDGETYYREYLETYKEDIMNLLKKKVEELTEEEKAIIEAYINIV